MKTKLFTLTILTLMSFSICLSQMTLKSIPETGFPGANVLIMEDGTNYFSRTLIDVLWDDTSILENVKIKNSDLISLVVPENATIGFHTIKIILDDNIEGLIPFEIKNKPVDNNTTINGQDPDPNTQNGKPIWAGKEPKPIQPGEIVYNPSGGYRSNMSIPCDSLHKIDGKMTDSVYQSIKEWSNVYPLPGRFSMLYLDYCDATKTMYVLNDWFNGTGRYDSNSCYNRFHFKTGAGAEEWEIRVFHSYNKPVEVIRNGINVSSDTNYVLAGRYANEESILVDSAHTIYEFGIKVISGVFFMPMQHDPYSPPEGPKVEVICDDDGYGLVQEPGMLAGELGNGSRSRREDRYIPIQGVAGLVLEDNSFSGKFSGDSSSIRFSSGNLISNFCSKNHVIDGLFSPDEWTNTNPAKGRYSNLYADFCEGKLFILNDWILAKQEPDEQNCYNLFELYTGNVSEHWGIYVYHDTTKGIKVFLNGKDVSKDTNIVFGGRFGFESSSLEDSAHTIYEFSIKASEGFWNLMLCDPGPSSFCDDNDAPAPRAITPRTGSRIPDSDTYPGDHTSVIQVSEQKHVKLIMGTSDDSKDWFSRNFKANINFNPDVVKNIQISLPDSNLIADSLKLSENLINSGNMEVIGSSNQNFRDNGDLFVLDADVIANGKSINSELNIAVLLGNRTTYMRKFTVPKTIFDITTGIDDEIPIRQQISNINLYPNPNKGSGSSTLEFVLINNCKVEIALFDVNGNKTELFPMMSMSQGLNILSIPTINITSGTYFIKLSTGNYSRIVKLEVIK